MNVSDIRPPATDGDPEHTFRIQVPADARYARYVRQRVTGFASRYVVADEDFDEFLIAIGEALANAVEHAHSTGPIEISCWFASSDRLIATIVDRGIGFASAAPVVVSAELPDDYAERGRGLAIMTRCTDIFAVQSEPGKGTSVILGRSLRQREAAPA